MRRIISTPVMGSLALSLIALLFAPVPAGATGPTTVAELRTALCGGATVPLELDIDEAGAVLTVAGGCTATLDLNGHTLTVSRVVLGAGADLTIRDTSASADGELIAQGAVNNEAGIRTTGATLRIESGTVSATGGVRGAGIGGGDHADGGTVTISGGTVTATGGQRGAGIGGGEFADGGTVTVSGGTVTVSSGKVAAGSGAGIGGGNRGSGGTITVTGGTVTASGRSNGAGIGGGQNGEGGTVTISGGTVTATSSFTADWYGIGPGSGRTAGVVTIGPGLIRTDTEPTAGQRRTTLTPEPVPVPDSEPAAAPVLALSCAPSVPVVGGLVTCTLTGGGAGIDISWRAAYNPVFAEEGVTLDASGSGVFSFVVPAAAVGEVISVELVEWLAPVSLGAAGGPVPASIPAGEGPVAVWPVLLLALAGGLGLRRRSRSGWPPLRVS